MQILKNEVKEDILKAARKEFLDSGFRSASLRRIASEAGITVGNIYRYFKNKDTLFRELLAPVIGQIELMKMGLRQHSEADQDAHEEEEEHNMIIDVAYSFIMRHREDLQLLLSHSGGSSLEKYEEEMIRWYAGLYYSNLKDGAAQMGVGDLYISEDTLYIVAKSVVDSAKLCIEKEMTKEQVKVIAAELFEFYGGGSMNLLKSKLGR